MSREMIVIAAAALVVLQAVTIAALIVQARRRRRAEHELAAKEAALRQSYDEIRTLAGRLINTQEDERTRIARELHDDIGQSIAALGLQVAALTKGRDGHQSLEAALASLHDAVGDVADDIRALSRNLHPHAIGHIGLVPALAAHCREIRSRQGFDVRFDAAPDLGDLPSDVTLCLYRIAQEALHNTCQHSRARSARVALTRTAAAVELSVEDDGIGFELAETRRRSRGLGLASMEERVRLVNGSLAVDTARGRGTRLAASVPVEVPDRVMA